MENTLTIDIIRTWQPCYDPARYAPEGWTGSILDILQHPDISAEDKVWCASQVMTPDQLYTFAVHCEDRLQHYAELSEDAKFWADRAGSASTILASGAVVAAIVTASIARGMAAYTRAAADAVPVEGEEIRQVDALVRILRDST